MPSVLYQHCIGILVYVISTKISSTGPIYFQLGICFILIISSSEKYLNLEGLLEKSLKIIYALKSTGKSLKGPEKSLNSTIFFMTTLLIGI